MGCHSLLQGIFLTQGSNSGLLHCSRFFTVWAIRETCLFILLCLIFCYAIFINHRLNHAPSLQVSVKFSSWNKNSLEKMWIRSNIYDKVLWFRSCSCSRWVNNAKMRWTNGTHQSPRAGKQCSQSKKGVQTGLSWPAPPWASPDCGSQGPWEEEGTHKEAVPRATHKEGDVSGDHLLRSDWQWFYVNKSMEILLKYSTVSTSYVQVCGEETIC